MPGAAKQSATGGCVQWVKISLHLTDSPQAYTLLLAKQGTPAWV